MSGSYLAAKWTVKPANIGRRAEANGARCSGWRLLAIPAGAREPQSGWVLAPRSASHAWHRGWCVEPACSAPYLTRSLARSPRPAGLRLYLTGPRQPETARVASNRSGKTTTLEKPKSESVFLFSLNLVINLTLLRGKNRRRGTRRTLTHRDLVLVLSNTPYEVILLSSAPAPPHRCSWQSVVAVFLESWCACVFRWMKRCIKTILRVCMCHKGVPNVDVFTKKINRRTRSSVTKGN